MSDAETQRDTGTGETAGETPRAGPSEAEAVAAQARVVENAAQQAQALMQQAVAQATALAVQDAADYLRNVQALSTAAQGMALNLLLQTRDPAYATVMAAAQEAVQAAQRNLAEAGKTAAAALREVSTPPDK